MRPNFWNFTFDACLEATGISQRFCVYSTHCGGTGTGTGTGAGLSVTALPNCVDKEAHLPLPKRKKEAVALQAVTWSPKI